MDTNETTIYTAVLISSAVTGLLLLYFAVTMYRSHSKHFRLLRGYFYDEMELLEKERNRIARDLHDELGPLLVLTKIHLSQVTSVNREDRKRINTAIENTERLTERFGGIARNLTPRMLASKGLAAALEEYVEQYNEASTIQMQLDYRIQRRPDHYYALHLYRIVQELIHNAARHSGADMLHIQLAEHRNRIYLLYTDNGKGINEASLQKGEGLGVKSLQNRAVMMGGKLEFKSDAVHGTEYYFEIPINEFYEGGNKPGDRR